jgi:phosphoribosylformylglycinamidine cyclo-ligase
MSSDTSKRYALREFQQAKKTHNAIKNIDKGLFQAFCKIVPDYLTQDEDYCLIMHADGAGTKSSLAYILERNMIYQYGRHCPGCINHEY